MSSASSSDIAARRIDGERDRAATVDAAQLVRREHRVDLRQFGQAAARRPAASPAARRRGARCCSSRLRAQDDRQTAVAVEVFAQPLAVAERAHDGAQLGTAPADFGQATVVGIDAQLWRAGIGIGPGLHVRTRESFGQQLAPGFGRARQRVAVGVLQVDGDSACGAAEAAEQLTLAGERAGVGEADHYFVADDAFEFADVGLDRRRAHRWCRRRTTG